MAYTEFYVTKGGSVSNVNGGGPNLGAGDGPVLALVGGGGAGATSDALGTTITDLSGGGWAACAVDDWLCFDTAAAKEFARITNIAGNAATVTPAVTGNQADKSCNVGGAWATLDHAGDTVSTLFVNAAGSPPRVNIKYNVAAYAEQADFDHDGTATIPLTFEGYESSAGDDCPNGNFPHFESAGVLYPGIIDTNDMNNLVFRNLKLTATGADIEGVNFNKSAECWFERLHIKATGAGAHGMYGHADSRRPTLVDIYVEDAAEIGIRVDGSTGVLVGCEVHSAGDDGIQVRMGVVAFCIVDSAGAVGIELSSSQDNAVITNCSVYNATGNGIHLPGGTGHVVRNCILEGCGGWGIQMPVLSDEDYNAFFNNTNGEVTGGLRSGAHDVTLTGSPFTNAGASDFTLDNVAGEGADCRDAGFPGAMLSGGNNEGHIDIGALQHEDPAGGAAGGAQVIGGFVVR